MSIIATNVVSGVGIKSVQRGTGNGVVPVSLVNPLKSSLSLLTYGGSTATNISLYVPTAITANGGWQLTEFY